MKAHALALALGGLACSAAAGERPVSTAQAPAAEPSPGALQTTEPEPQAEAGAAPEGEGRLTETSRRECNLLLGPAVAGEWFSAGFEQLVGDRYWQAIFSPQGLVQHWTDPAHAAWREPLVSACMHNGEAPDRVVLVAVNFDYKTREQWLSALTDAVETLKKKYPSAKRIDLMTMIRGPQGASCGDARSVVAPYVDDAVDNVATNYPDLVKAAPKFEMDSCSAFTKGGRHFTAEGAAAAARLVGQYFAGAQG